MADRDEPRGERPRGDRPNKGRPRRDGPPRPGGSGPRRSSGSGAYRSGGDRPRTPYGPSDRPRRDGPPTDRLNRDDRANRDERQRQENRPRFDDHSRRDDKPRGDQRPRYGDQRPRYDDRPRGDDRPRYDDRGPGREGRHQRDDRNRDRAWQDRPRRPYPPRPYAARPPYAAARRPPEPGPEREGLLGEDDELIAGRRPVEEAFAARREAIRLLIVPERRAALDALAIHATTLRIPVVEVEGGTLTSLAGFDGHQGVALVARPRPGGDPDQILARGHERGEAAFILVLDSLEDPQNFGTLLRSAEAVGVHGVIYPTRRAAPLSPAAIKASAGATEHLVLAAVDDLGGTLADLHGRGLRVVGADEDASLDYSEADLRGPLAIVVGSEGRGISGTVRKRLDLTVRIPMRGKIASLNAAVAGSILLFGAAAQRPVGAPPAEAEADEPQQPPAEQKPPRSKVAKTAKTAKAARAEPAEAKPAKPKAAVASGKKGKTPGKAKKKTADDSRASSSHGELLPGD